MDNRKTGQLIAELRKEKSMTQQDLADKLHVTNTAVSKWERGLSFPGVDILEKLAEELGITVMDILAGEVIKKTEEKISEISIDVMRTEKKKRNKIYILGIIIAMVFSVIFFFDRYGPAIFQKGYPVPYIKAMMKISDETPLVKVKEGIYITETGEKQAVFDYIKEKYDAELIEQAGSGYIFSNGTDILTVSSEIYWRKYTVWSIPDITLQTK
ncbi:MAG: helix-turn-helix transcriptional regulator [Clostridia bacterium]|nr:helix-turn-helix transcriptional regulator [Clostridia bacterium]